MIWLTDKIEFPPYNSISKYGIIALGGDLSAERLIQAYNRGIFPWYSENEPIVWHCPEKRMVLFPNDLKISKSMKKLQLKNSFQITYNNDFEKVINLCRNIKRKDSIGTWITDAMENAYLELHKLGHAKSIEVWEKNQLVGGLYGVEVGDVFCGESMFSLKPNASKIAFINLVQSKKYSLIDCQVYNKHLESLGAKEIRRSEFLKFLEQ